MVLNHLSWEIFRVFTPHDNCFTGYVDLVMTLAADCLHKRWAMFTSTIQLTETSDFVSDNWIEHALRSLSSSTFARKWFSYYYSICLAAPKYLDFGPLHGFEPLRESWIRNWCGFPGNSTAVPLKTYLLSEISILHWMSLSIKLST